MLQTDSQSQWTYRVLVVDDDPNIAELCSDILDAEGYEVEPAGNPAAAESKLSGGDFDIVLTDVRMPGCNGLEFLSSVLQMQPEIDVVVMTGYGSIDLAVDSLKGGACDFISKPFSPEDLSNRMKRLIEKRELQAETRLLRGNPITQGGPAGLVGQSTKMNAVLQLLTRFSGRLRPVLILGESGTGKELIARALHELGPQPAEPFVPVDCGAFSSSLIESELFGHRQGAFTGAMQSRTGLLAAAGRGTVFLDEIGELALDLQAKLLRVLQEREFRPLGRNDRLPLRARVIAATNRDLARAVADGKFRADLYYRLNVLCIEIPPLRERKEDIPTLVQAFLHRERVATNDARVTGISNGALQCLQRYSWPGNVRELQNHVHRAMALSDGPLVQVRDLAPELRSAAKAADERAGLSRLDEAERVAIARVLVETGGNRLQAAQLLGLGKTTLYKKLKIYGLKYPAATGRSEFTS